MAEEGALVVKRSTHNAERPHELLAPGILTVGIGATALALGLLLGGVEATLSAGSVLPLCGLLGGGLGAVYALRGAAEHAGTTAYLGSAWRLPLVATTLVVIVAVLTEPPVRFEYLGCAALFALGAGVGGLSVSALWIAVRRRPE